MELLGKVVTGAAQNLGLEMLYSLVNPFSTCSADAFVASAAPGVGPRIVGVIGSPKESDASTCSEAFCNMLTNISYVLLSMG
jgi:hypothetical protein